MEEVELQSALSRTEASPKGSWKVRDGRGVTVAAGTWKMAAFTARSGKGNFGFDNKYV